MKKYLAQAAFKSSDSDIKYSMYIGRWQPWHKGHRWLIEHCPPDQIKEISATRIRNKMKEDGKL